MVFFKNLFDLIVFIMCSHYGVGFETVLCLMFGIVMGLIIDYWLLIKGFLLDVCDLCVFCY